MVLPKITETIEIPEGVTIELVKKVLKTKGPKGEIERKFSARNVSLSIATNQIILSSEKPTKREKKMINTFKAHIKNMLEGVKGGYIYKLKICSGHFPMTVTVEEDKLIIKNFVGEKVPRKAKILQNVKVEIAGEEITVESANKEAAGQTASNIELATIIRNKDRRIFQDGIYITEKAIKTE